MALREVKIGWKGTEHVLPSDQILRTIAKIEDHVTIGELHRWSERGAVPYGKLALAYGIVLRACGIRVTDEQVHDAMFEGQGEMQPLAIQAIKGLLFLMIPPVSLTKKIEELREGAGGTSAGKDTATSTAS